MNRYFVPGAILGSQNLWQAQQTFADDILLRFGNDGDIVLLNRSTSLGADEELAGVIEGTSDHQGVAANSLILSNVTNDGDIMILVSDGGNSREALRVDADVAVLDLGFAMLATNIYQNAIEHVAFTSGITVFNEDSNNLDFRIESDGNPNIFVVDATLDNIGLGGAVDTAAFLRITPGAQNRALQTSIGWGIDLVVDTITSSTTDTDAIGAYAFFGTPTLAGASATYTATIAATVYIEGAPVQGSQASIGTAYALLIDGGDFATDGNIIFRGAQDFVMAVGTSNAFQFTNGTGAYMTIDTRANSSGARAVRFDVGANPSFAAGATTHYHEFDLESFTLTFTGSTGVTTPIDGLSMRIAQSTITDASSLTITQASTLYVPAITAGGSVTITTNLAAEFDGSVMITSGRLLQTQGADVASTNNLVLGTDGNTFEITGTTDINLISNLTWQNGATIRLLFTSTATVKDAQATSTTNITILLDGSADFVPSAGDTLQLTLCEIGGTQAWRETGSRNVL